MGGPRNLLSVQQPDGSWREVHGVRAGKLEPEPVSPGRITGAGRRLVEWLGRIAPEHRLQLGLQRPYLPHNRRRMAQRRQHRRMVAASRRANR